MNHIYTTAGFIILGMNSWRPSTKAPVMLEAINAIQERGDMGVLELVSHATAWAEHICNMCLVGHAMTEENDGVFDYEVSEQFGNWYAQQVVAAGGVVPRRQACANEILRLATRFYLEGRNAARAKQVEAALAAVPVVNGEPG